MCAEDVYHYVSHPNYQFSEGMVPEFSNNYDPHFNPKMPSQQNDLRSEYGHSKLKSFNSVIYQPPSLHDVDEGSMVSCEFHCLKTLNQTILTYY